MVGVFGAGGGGKESCKKSCTESCTESCSKPRKKIANFEGVLSKIPCKISSRSKWSKSCTKILHRKPCDRMGLRAWLEHEIHHGVLTIHRKILIVVLSIHPRKQRQLFDKELPPYRTLLIIHNSQHGLRKTRSRSHCG
jgi:hypothetical protein